MYLSGQVHGPAAVTPGEKLLTHWTGFQILQFLVFDVSSLLEYYAV
jgi:hypothetical protein